MMITWLRRKRAQLRRLVNLAPLVWGAYDFDYRSAIDLFKAQLANTAAHLERPDAYGVDAKLHAQKIRTAIRLMDKVYNEDYANEAIDLLIEKYGEQVLEAEFKDTGDGDGTKYMTFKYEQWDNADQIRKDRKRILDQCHSKQARAHKLLWDFIAHNIQHWWD